MENKIKVVVVDDHDLIREGLNRIISFEEDLLICEKLKNGKEVMEYLDENNVPDVILLDINMPYMNGIEALRLLKERYKELKVIMLTVENDKKTILEAMDMRADGYILKESAGSDIVTAIRRVYNGENYIDKSLINIMFTGIKNEIELTDERKEITKILTKREISILKELSKGLKNKEIAEILFLSEKTVKNYITGIFKKIGVEDRVKATLFAIKHNINDI